MRIDFDLQLFTEGVAASGASASSGSVGNDSVANQEKSSLAGNKAGSSQRQVRASKEYENVRFVKEDESPADTSDGSSDAGNKGNNKGPVVTTDAKDLNRREFAKLIGKDGQYNEAFTEMFQQRFDQRFKDHKLMEETMKAQSKIVDTLQMRYGTKDLAALQEAIEKDDQMWYEAAEEAGMPVEQFKQYRKVMLENERFKAQESALQREREANAQATKWYQEAEQLKTVYPQFDLHVELQDPSFVKLLQVGIPMRRAYETQHYEEFFGSSIEYVKNQTEKNVVANIQARGQRPPENGMVHGSGVTYRTDVSKFTKTDRAEIARRTLRGERL